MTATADSRLARLVARLDEHPALAIAVSGGVDSMVLAYAASRFSKTKAALYHAVSPAVPKEARQRLES